jgi:hypothetical protein
MKCNLEIDGGHAIETQSQLLATVPCAVKEKRQEFGIAGGAGASL